MKVECSIKAELRHDSEVLSDGRQIEKICLTNIMEDTKDAVITVEWNFPILDIAGRWHPCARADRSLKADWCYGEMSMSSVSAPVIAFFSEDGNNRGTFAVSETLKKVRMSLGVHEEDGTMKCKVYIYLGELGKDNYTVSILSDYRDVRYEQSLREVSAWWENDCGLAPAYVPDDARDPMYSFWYSYHQEFTDAEIEEECKRAGEMGFKTVIVDDGWQTDDTNRGYGYCGDWEPAEKKIKNMKQHIDNVHKLGMKYLIWFSVPYVGMYSEKWAEFKDKLIAIDEEQHTGILDIRYAEVRKYLRKIYTDAVTEWGLDGLKLDFIDEFYERKDTPKANENMDCTCLQEALDKLLGETMEDLKALNKEILIEFRQRYVGPSIRRYGNILRVGDCPNSGISNRVGITDLRLLSGKTAVHSDMLMWNKDEKAEVAALQIIDCLFGTLQFSVRLDQISEEQTQMVKNYMAFMQENKALLQEADITAEEPQNLYPVIRVSNSEKDITAVYSKGRVIELCTDVAENNIVNGTKENVLYIETKETEEVEVTVYDCCGKTVSEGKQILSGIAKINCPIGGRVEIKRRK